MIAVIDVAFNFSKLHQLKSSLSLSLLSMHLQDSKRAKFLNQTFGSLSQIGSKFNFISMRSSYQYGEYSRYYCSISAVNFTIFTVINVALMYYR